MSHHGGRTRRAGVLVGATVMSVIAVLAGCSARVDGQAVSPLYDPFHVGGLPAVDGPSGPRADAPAPTGRVVNSDKGDIDALALSAVNDVEQFWSTHYDKPPFANDFRRVARLVSYDANDRTSPPVCGRSPYQVPNAFYCPRERSIAWDRGELLPMGEKYFGPMAVVGLIAHEYGHAVQHMAETIDQTSPPIVKEQQADCYAGVYMRWVAEGQSPRMTLSTGDGLSQVLAALIAVRDPIMGPGDTEMLEMGHGTALDRVSAFQTGFVSGTGACAAIDLREIEERRGELPMALRENSSGALETGEAPINQSTVAALLDTLNRIYTPSTPPTVTFGPATCPDAQASPPASYCPATRTISLELDALRKAGSPGDESDFVLVQGDNTALSMIVSRYMLAIQQDRGLTLDSPSAALRTACLTGAAQRRLIDPVGLPSGDSLVLTAGDIDEAVAGLLTNGRVATDVDGDTVPAGFTRIVAFESGLGDRNGGELCYRRFT